MDCGHGESPDPIFGCNHAHQYADRIEGVTLDLGRTSRASGHGYTQKPMSANQIFLLSPANCSGKRAGYLLRKDGASPLAHRLRSEGATLGEVFTFMSGLYFRGKLAYASAFADPPDGFPGVQVIVPGRGLCPPDEMIDLKTLRAIARVPVDLDDRRYA